MVAGSGDNCNSLAGMGVVSAGDDAAANGAAGRGGDIMVSLGTSDTLLGVTTDPSPTTTGNCVYVLCNCQIFRRPTRLDHSVNKWLLTPRGCRGTFWAVFWVRTFVAGMV